MVLWRISKYRDLSGTGGLKAAGRWHYAGHPVVYLSENPASALLEVCVHTAANDIPPNFSLLKVEGPDVDIPSISGNDLPADWQLKLDVTRKFGAKWLRDNESVLLKVPSAIVPQTMNYLFNPLHADARAFRIIEILTYPFDSRLKE